MNTHIRTARIVGILYIIGTVMGILSLAFTSSIQDSEYLVKVSENETQVIIGALCVLTMGLALAVIPVVMYPILSKYNKALAMGYVVFRGALETVTYFGGVIAWISLIGLSHEYVNSGAADASYFHALGVALKEAAVGSDHVTTFVFSLGALMFYYVLYQSKLVPRWLSGWGLVAVILVTGVGFLALFGTDLMVLWAPLAVQEMVLALWLIIKGFNPSAIASGAA